MRYHNRDWSDQRIATRKQSLKANYNITEDDYNFMLEVQGGCFFCGLIPKKGERRLAVDHNHRTGTLRGLLCINHNTMLGFANDDPNILRLAANYLEQDGVWLENPNRKSPP